VPRSRRGPKRRKRPRQTDLPFKHWGGTRPGAGRKPKGARAGVSHKTRAPLASRYPVHVTVRVREKLPSLRNERTFRVLQRAFGAGCDRFGFRLVHFSVQSNHVHMLAEALDRRALSRGMQGLGVRIAKALNKHWDRKGTVFADRYHDRILRTPREVRHALVYVLHNARKHGKRFTGWDFFSSAPWFDGWREHIAESVKGLVRGTPPLAAARTWLLTAGWRRHGRIGLDEAPARGT
jgi:putative transposase